MFRCKNLRKGKVLFMCCFATTNFTRSVIEENFTVTICSRVNRRLTFASADVLHFKTVYRHPSIPQCQMLLFVLRKENAGVDVDLDFVSEGNGFSLRQATVGRPHGIRAKR
ncbi:TPA: hypothetical protein R6G12_004611 [Klebsiella pneumoniae]|nr:hypothetical protein [Klebsiella pneumoniae]